MNRGRFITFEGGEGAGKSTQVRLLAEALRSLCVDVHISREPGGSEGAEKIRPLLVTGDYAWDVHAEYLLFSAARSDHLAKVIRPELEAGTWVICDRFYDSSYVYQGIAQGLDKTFMRQVYEGISGGFYPDLTLVLDLDVSQALVRCKGRGQHENRFEEKGTVFHEAVRAGFLTLAQENAERFAVIDAGQDQSNVAASVLECVQKRFSLEISKVSGLSS
jgi:dTMP kinase